MIFHQTTTRRNQDWIIRYRDENGDVEAMAVRGAETIEKALEEADRSLSLSPDDPDQTDGSWYEIVSIEMDERPRL